MANFAVAGALTVAGGAGLASAGGRRTGGGVAALVAATGAGLLVSGRFPTDPVNGYPPGTPDQLSPPSPASVKHNLAAVPIFAGLPVAVLLSARRSWRDGGRGWAAWSGAVAGSALVNVPLFGAGFGGSRRLAPRAGIHQRAAVGALLGWVSTACLAALRRSR